LIPDFLRHGAPFCRELNNADQAAAKRCANSAFPLYSGRFSAAQRALQKHGTEAAIAMERDTSPADVNLNK
jgi:hypothetical protein